MPKSVGTGVSKGFLGLATERESRAVLNLRFWFAAGGCTAVPFCCTVLPEVFTEMPSSVHPSPFYSLYLPFQPLSFYWFVLAGFTQSDHCAASAACLSFVLGFDFESIFRYSYGVFVGVTGSAGGGEFLSLNLPQHCHVIGFRLLWGVSKLSNSDPMTLAPRLGLPPQR